MRFEALNCCEYVDIDIQQPPSEDLKLYLPASSQGVTMYKPASTTKMLVG